MIKEITLWYFYIGNIWGELSQWKIQQTYNEITKREIFNWKVSVHVLSVLRVWGCIFHQQMEKAFEWIWDFFRPLRLLEIVCSLNKFDKSFCFALYKSKLNVLSATFIFLLLQLKIKRSTYATIRIEEKI